MGPLEVLREGRMLDLGPPRQRAVLAVMLLRANEVVPRERLIDEIWGETTPASAPNMIQVYVSGLRKSLGDDLLLTQAGGYVLQVAEEQLDAARFTALVARAREAMNGRRARDARAILEDAMQLWRGPPLADFTYESFAQGEIARLEELRLEAIELRTDAELELGQHLRLVGELEQLVALYPFRERLRGQLMLALYRSGRQTEALDAYRVARRTLVDELGIEPAVELQQLERAILAQDAELGPGRAERPIAAPVSNGSSAANLPTELTTLIGRDADIERIAALVTGHRLVTLAGPAGVGKTRVAVRVARNLRERFEDGVRYVDLAAIDQGGDVAVAVAAAVGIADRPGAETLDTVMVELVGKRVLIVLDNCEHVLSASADVAGRLVTLCPGVQMLATTREPLAIPGERVVRLRPLATTPNGAGLPPAVELFLDRAATHGAVWANRERVLPTIQEVCDRLDGIPLAIELAAARTPAMSPAQLLARLDDRFRLLARPRHASGYARQQTLEAAITWSYDLLSTEEQGTLRRLAVFQGGFSLAAAAAVCADIGSELDIVERVTALVDRSVVSIEWREDDDRYRLLESIGLFANRRLREHSETNGARGRQAGFFLSLVRGDHDQLHGGEQSACAGQLDIEQDNIAFALTWCFDGDGDPDVGAELAAGLGWHWILRGRSNLARRWLERALELREQISTSNLVAVHVAYALLWIPAGDMETGWRHANEAVSLARTLDSDDPLAEALHQLALIDNILGARFEAAAAAEELRRLQPHLSSPRARANALLGTAQVALASGQPKQAAGDAAEARDIARQAGDSIRAANTGFWLAYALALSSALPDARAAIEEAATDAIRSGYQLIVVDTMTGEITIALAAGDLDDAARRVPEALQMYRDQQRWDDIGSLLWISAGIEFKRGFPERSAVLLGASRRRTQRLDFQDELLLPDLAELGKALTTTLGDGSFADATARGAAMDLDEVVSFLSSS